MKSGLFFVLVALIHHASSMGLGCGFGHHYGHHGGCGCGLLFPSRPLCSHVHTGDDWCTKGAGGAGEGKDCVPLVVRPHDLPKPQLSPQIAVEFTKPVAGPCAIKKAIVKPAVLPKPICRHHHHHGCCESSCHSTCCHDHHSHHYQHLGLHGSLLAGAHAAANAASNSQIPHGAVFGPNGLLGPNGPLGPGALRPADAVSLDLAYKLAQQNDIRKLQSEDKLNFGFRKLPVELPPKQIIQKNVPEEKIFSLNGHIVELKPVRPSGLSPSNLADEAVEQLIQLQEDEAVGLDDESLLSGLSFGGPRRPTLGEIGFGAAKPPTPNLIDIPATALRPGAMDSCEHGRDICTNCGCGHHVSFNHHGHCGCHQSCDCHSSCNCNCEEKCCKIIPGNVEYKTHPKPQQICLPVPEVPDSCESQEIEISREEGPQCVCSCVPVCMKKCSTHCRKSCVNIEKSIY